MNFFLLRPGARIAAALLTLGTLGSVLAQAPAGTGLISSKSISTVTGYRSVASGSAPAALPAPADGVGASGPADGVRVLLTADMETVLLAQIVGRIVTLNGTLGGRVSKGQLVVGMDCSESQARLKMSDAEMASARETYDSKLRLKGLDAAGDIEVSLAAAAVSKAAGQIEMTKAQIQNCSVYAPFAGRIVKLHVKPFQGVSAGQPLVEIVGEGAPRLRLHVPSRWLRSIRVKTAFEITVDETGRTYQAAVSAINGRVDAIAQTIELEARITGRYPELLPGMSGLARFNLSP